ICRGGSVVRTAVCHLRVRGFNSPYLHGQKVQTLDRAFGYDKLKVGDNPQSKYHALCELTKISAEMRIFCCYFLLSRLSSLSSSRAIRGFSFTSTDMPNDFSSATSKLKEAGMFGFLIGSPFKIDSYAAALPTTSSDFIVNISCKV